jgi:hypothetical protein
MGVFRIVELGRISALDPFSAAFPVTIVGAALRMGVGTDQVEDLLGAFAFNDHGQCLIAFCWWLRICGRTRMDDVSGTHGIPLARLAVLSGERKSTYRSQTAYQQ